jgi:hypothetical protein
MCMIPDDGTSIRAIEAHTREEREPDEILIVRISRSILRSYDKKFTVSCKSSFERYTKAISAMRLERDSTCLSRARVGIAQSHQIIACIDDTSSRESERYRT